jgi:plastocyanin
MTASRRIVVVAVTAVAMGLTLGLGACSSSSPSSPTVPSTGGGGGGGGGTVVADVTITITGMNAAQSFSPDPGAITQGQTVSWHNADTVAHTATSTIAGGFDTGEIPPGGTSTPITMATAGTFTYACMIHPSMTGTLTITP